MDNKGQISAELILIISAMVMIILIVAYYSTNILEDITNHTKAVINNTRNTYIGQL